MEKKVAIKLNYGLQSGLKIVNSEGEGWSEIIFSTILI